MPEYYTANRLQGNIGFLKIMYKFDDQRIGPAGGVKKEI
jgi:hypothetical protein